MDSKIEKLEQDIAYADEKLTNADEAADIAYWREEKKQLRKEKEQLQEERLLLLRKVEREEMRKAEANASEGDSKKTKRSVYEEEAHAASYFNELLEAPGELPSSVDDIQLFLSQIPAKLPLRLRTYHDVGQPQLVTISNSAREEKLTKHLENAFFCIKQVPGNETQSSHYLCSITGGFLKYLDENAPVGKQLLGLETMLDSANLGSSTTALSALKWLKRPDFQLFVSETLLLRRENKIDPANHEVALKENVEKLKVWSPLYYGGLPYVIGGGCGGRLFQWLKLSQVARKSLLNPFLLFMTYVS